MRIPQFPPTESVRWSGMFCQQQSLRTDRREFLSLARLLPMYIYYTAPEINNNSNRPHASPNLRSVDTWRVTAAMCPAPLMPINRVLVLLLLMMMIIEVELPSTRPLSTACSSIPLVSQSAVDRKVTGLLTSVRRPYVERSRNYNR